MFLDSPQNIPTNNKVRGSMVVVYNIALLPFFTTCRKQTGLASVCFWIQLKIVKMQKQKNKKTKTKKNKKIKVERKWRYKIGAKATTRTRMSSPSTSPLTSLYQADRCKTVQQNDSRVTPQHSLPVIATSSLACAARTLTMT